MKPGLYNVTLKAELDICEEISVDELQSALVRASPGNHYAVCHPTRTNWKTGGLRILQVDGLPVEEPALTTAEWCVRGLLHGLLGPVAKQTALASLKHKAEKNSMPYAEFVRLVKVLDLDDCAGAVDALHPSNYHKAK